MGLLSGAEQDKKPLARSWFKKNPGQSSPVEHIRLSGSEEWILIECVDFVALLNAESKVGKAFWKNCQAFNGKAKGLECLPAKGKLGFDLEPSELIGYWEWDGENKVEFLDTPHMAKVNGLTADLWEKMQAQPKIADNIIAANKKRAGKKSVEDTENSLEQDAVDREIEEAIRAT